MLTLFVCFGEDLEQLLPHRYWLSLVADLFHMLLPINKTPLGRNRDLHLAFCRLWAPKKTSSLPKTCSMVSRSISLVRSTVAGPLDN